jgi:DNA processing protein
MTSRDPKDYWLMLLHLPIIGYAAIAKILKKFPVVSDFFSLDMKEFLELGLSPQTVQALINPSWDVIIPDLEWESKSNNHHILTLADRDYPFLLRQIAYPPPVLFIWGDSALLNWSQIAIVGSRSPTRTGKEIAFRLAMELSDVGLAVTSGLAYGIDTAAHEGVLQKGNKTIAVIGTGINICYPRTNYKLYGQIAEVGAIVSQFTYNTPPSAQNFPRRNQLISGLSLGTLVVEASLKSGSLITANSALEQGREVFAVPGSIYNPLARGCHSLIKEGAKLVENIQDILEELPFAPLCDPRTSKEPICSFEKVLEETHIKLLECVGFEPTKIDLLVERSSLPIPIVTSLLVDLELAGVICLTMSGYMRVSR